MKTVLKKLYHALWPALTGMLLALGLVLPALRALNLACYGAAVFACAITAVFLTFIGARGVCALAGGACGALTLALAVLTGNTLPRLGGMLGAMFALVNGSAAALQMYAPEVAAVLAVLLTLVGWSLALGPGGFIPAFSLELIAVLACWVAGLREEFYLFAPGLVALMALLCLPMVALAVREGVIEDAPMVEALAYVQSVNSEYSIINNTDRVHPGTIGHDLMARVFLHTLVDETVAVPTNEQLLSYVQGSAQPDTELGVPLELRVKAQKALTGAVPLAVRGYWEAEFHCVGTNNYGRSPEERQALVDRYECGDFRGTVLKPRYAANAAALGANMAATRQAVRALYE